MMRRFASTATLFLDHERLAMLLKLRGGLNSVLVTILLSVLILAFAIWGIGPGILQGANDVVADVDGVEVPTTEYVNAVQNRIAQIQTQVPGIGDTQTIIQSFGIDRQVLSEMVRDARIAAHTRDVGLVAGNKQIAKEISSVEAFQLGGAFAPDIFRQVLASQGMTEASFYERVRQAVKRQQLFTVLGSPGFDQNAYAKALYTHRNERRWAQIMSIRVDDVPFKKEATEDELLADWEAEKAAYETPERRSYRYIYVTPQLYIDGVEITEEAVLSAYEDSEADYVQPELRTVLQVNVSDEATANAIRDRVIAGEAFVDVAAELSSFSADEIDLGDLSKDDVAQDYGDDAADIVFSLDTGGVSDPVEALIGFSLYAVSSITPAVATPLEMVRGEIEASLREELAIDAMYDALPDIQDAVLDLGDLEQVAERTGLTLASVTAVTSTGIDRDGQSTVRSQEDANLVTAAFQAELGDPEDIVDIDPEDRTKGAYVLEVTEIIEPTDPPFEDVRAEVLSSWTQKQKLLAAGALADEARARIDAGEDFDVVAAELNLVALEVKNAAREGGDDGQLAPTIRRLIFDLSVGEAGVERSTDGYAVIKLNDIIPGDAAANAAGVTEILEELKQGFDTDIVEQYQAWLIKEYPANINAPVVDQLFRSNVAN